jgi:hypothetical protein
MSSVTVVTLPTSIALLQSGDVVSRCTISYPARLDSGLASQLSVVRLVPARVPGGVAWISTFGGVPGLAASAYSAAAFTRATLWGSIMADCAAPGPGPGWTGPTGRCWPR